MEYLHTDWAAMTLNDWLGVFYTVLAFIGMIVVYVWVLNPKRKDALNAHADTVLREDELNNSGR
jgi:hypothetical protein